MKIYGYIRVSSTDQNESRQLLAMQELDIPQKQIYMDKRSFWIQDSTIKHKKHSNVKFYGNPKIAMINLFEKGYNIIERSQGVKK